MARLLREVPDTWVSVSITTRAPRAGEVDGVHYFFVEEAEFDRLHHAVGGTVLGDEAHAGVADSI